MSETVNYTGKLKLLTLEGLIKIVDETVGTDIDDFIYENIIDVDGKFYEILKKELNSDGDTFRANKNEDGTIDFIVQYHNGGMSFDEAIRESLDSL